MKNLWKKIKKILNTNLTEGLGDLLYNFFEFICVKIIYNIYCFTLKPFVTFFSSFKKISITILVFLLSFNFFVYMGASLERVPPNLGYSSNEYFKNSQMITEEKMSFNIVKMTYYYENVNLEECKKNYQLTWGKTKNMYTDFNITGIECNKTVSRFEKKRIRECKKMLKNGGSVVDTESCNSKKTTDQYYTYEIVAEASLFRKISCKIESLKMSLPYYFWGIGVVIGSIFLFPFLIIFNI